MKQLKTMAGCLCLCLAAGCTSPASQQENVAVTEGMTQSDVHIPEHTRSLSGSLLGYKTIP